MEALVTQDDPVLEVHLVRKAARCLDRKETREIRACRGLQDPLSTSTHQKISTSKESRDLQD